MSEKGHPVYVCRTLDGTYQMGRGKDALKEWGPKTGFAAKELYATFDFSFGIITGMPDMKPGTVKELHFFEGADVTPQNGAARDLDEWRKEP